MHPTLGYELARIFVDTEQRQAAQHARARQERNARPAATHRPRRRLLNRARLYVPRAR